MGVETKAPEILAGNLICFLTSSLFLIGRVYARAILLQQFGWDDASLLAGWFFALVTCIEACISTKFGAGMHEYDIDPSKKVPAIQLDYGTRLCYQAALCLIKLAIVLFYLRVFGTNRAVRWHLWAMFAFIVAYTIPLEITSALVCYPLPKLWKPELPGFCLNPNIGFWISFACNLISDIWILLFAIPRVWILQLQPRQKVALSITLSLGWLVVIAAIIRVIRISALLHSRDLTWNSYDSSIWSAVEVNVSIICAAAPALKPIFMKVAPGFMYSISGHNRQKTRASTTLEIHRPSRSKASTWLRSSSDPGSVGWVEMSDHGGGIKRSHMSSRSQELLSGSAAHNTWVSSTCTPSDDGRGVADDAIWKSTEVRIARDGDPSMLV